MPFSNLEATSGLFWASASVVALLDVGVVFLIVRRIDADSFRRLKWEIPIAALFFWSSLWAVLFWLAWDWFYSPIFPAWVRSLAPAFGLVYAAAAWVLFQLSRRGPGNPILIFCLLGGLEGFLTHLWAVYGLRAMDRVPMLKGVSPVSVLVFAFFEKILYWSVVLAAAAWLQRGLRRWKR